MVGVVGLVELFNSVVIGIIIVVVYRVRLAIVSRNSRCVLDNIRMYGVIIVVIK